MDITDSARNLAVTAQLCSLPHPAQVRSVARVSKLKLEVLTRSFRDGLPPFELARAITLPAFSRGRRRSRRCRGGKTDAEQDWFWDLATAPGERGGPRARRARSRWWRRRARRRRS